MFLHLCIDICHFVAVGFYRFAHVDALRFGQQLTVQRKCQSMKDLTLNPARQLCQGRFAGQRAPTPSIKWPALETQKSGHLRESAGHTGPLPPEVTFSTTPFSGPACGQLCTLMSSSNGSVTQSGCPIVVGFSLAPPLADCWAGDDGPQAGPNYCGHGHQDSHRHAAPHQLRWLYDALSATGSSPR